MKELDEEATGIIIGGQNFDNIRYADDAVFVSDEEHSLQEIVQKIADIYNIYGMEINVKKTKTMVISKIGNSKLPQRRPRRMWLDDIKSWTGLDSYEKIKNLANNRKSWRACSITCQPSDTEEDS